MNNNKISVIVPCYNSEKTIEQALISLKNQTYKCFDVLIIDDGSIDHTAEVSRRIAEKLNLNCKVFSKVNEGVSKARNIGLSYVKTEYVTFLDSDDEYHSDYLRVLFDEIEKNVDIAYGRYTMKNFKMKGNLIGYEAKVRSREEILEDYFNKKKNGLSFCNAIYRTEIISRNGICFPENIAYGEDAEFFCKYIYHCDRGGTFVETELYKYCQFEGSAMHNISYNVVQGIVTHQNIIDYWGKEYKGDKYYIIDRVKWSDAMLFAIHDKKCFSLYIREYDLKISMKRLIHTSCESLVKIGALFYLINPWVFYYIIRFFGKMINKYR